MRSFTRLILIFTFLLSFCLAADPEGNSTPLELGFWLGAANPFPGSETSRKLDSSLGLGFFGRVQWPFTLYTEFGAGFANYLSKTERGLTTVPVYGALGYKLPFELPVSFFVKAGGGASYVVARPSNTAKWNPLAVLGFEVSFVAGRKVRIGLRTDYHRILETIGNRPPDETRRLYLSPIDRDYRLSNPNYYRLKDVEFFYFSLMVSFLM